MEGFASGISYNLTLALCYVLDIEAMCKTRASGFDGWRDARGFCYSFFWRFSVFTDVNIRGARSFCSIQSVARRC